MQYNPNQVRERTLIIRADATPQMGSGHITRCRALAQAWRQLGGQAVFITSQQSPSLVEELLGEGFAVHRLDDVFPHPADLEKTMAIIQDFSGSWVVLDGYHFDSIYLERLSRNGNRILLIDDMKHLPEYRVDLILNQNLHAVDIQYKTRPDTKLLLGTRYALLRHEFSQWADGHRETGETAGKLLITLGGGDATELALKTMTALQELTRQNKLRTVLLGGGNNPRYHELEEFARKAAIPGLTVERYLADMPSQMAWADLAVAAAGSTLWEMAFMGLPALTIVRADNQTEIARRTEMAGCTVNLGWHESVTEGELVSRIQALIDNAEKRREMSEAGRRLVDGKGPERVIQALLDYEEGIL